VGWGSSVAKLTVVKPAEPTAIARLIDDYLAHCRASGHSMKTIKDAYGRPLRNILLPFLAEQKITDPGRLNSRVMDRLSVKLHDEGGPRGPLSPHSIHAYMRAINSFLSWAHAEGELGEVRAETPRLPKKLVDVLSREEIQAMEDAAQTERDKVIVRLLADTGLRVGELVGLKVSDIIERPGTRGSYYLKVTGKGARDRLVPIPGLYRRLRRLADKGRPSGANTDRLFVSRRRRPGGDYEPLDTSGVQQMVRLLAAEAGIEKRVYPHLLRHSYATWALTKGINPIMLADVLGHNSLTMIQQVYAHLAPQDAYAAMAKALRDDE
jgi:integrase/recombinase XerD